MDRNEVIKQIKTALQKRSGRSWSVTGGKGTAYGWLRIDAPPARRTKTHRLPAHMADIPENYFAVEAPDGGHYITDADSKILAELLDLETIHCQGVSIPSSNAYYNEYIARAEGRKPEKLGTPYWD